MSRPIEELVAEQSKTWSAVTPPNAAAVEMAHGLQGVIDAFEMLRGQMRFEEEPSSFEAALNETKE